MNNKYGQFIDDLELNSSVHCSQENQFVTLGFFLS